MGNQVYSRNEFMIISVSRGFIIINRIKGFKTGHTHLKNFKTAKYLIDLAIHKKVPNHLSPYLLTSLGRITGDEVYKEKVLSLRDTKNDKKQRYRQSA